MGIISNQVKILLNSFVLFLLKKQSLKFLFKYSKTLIFSTEVYLLFWFCLSAACPLSSNTCRIFSSHLQKPRTSFKGTINVLMGRFYILNGLWWMLLPSVAPRNKLNCCVP